MCLAVPGRVMEVEGAEPAFLRGKVDFGGVLKEVAFPFTPQVKPGEYVLVHAGFALQVVDEAEARKTLDDLKQLGMLDDEPEGPA
ncbi:MAG: HypC/HybG/HupF family hydrogenase formation chaperone [Candidatus Solibacter sp.]|nr:HypC/HybG/HupF family hydrogenase formation chaperone [Candidatus Solibacter sp.]